jgi:hypothetical protein
MASKMLAGWLGRGIIPSSMYQVTVYEISRLGGSEKFHIPSLLGCG